MLDINVLCVGLIRNGARTIQQSVEHIEQAFSFTKSRRWLVIESDSDDETLSSLQHMNEELPNFSYLSLGKLADRMPARTQRIAFCRNRYLQEIFANPEYANIDYVVMADLDGVNQGLDWRAALSCWTRTDWDACFANQTGAYYDIWALRHPAWSANDCWQQVNFLSQQGVSSEFAAITSIAARMIEIPPQSPWIAVNSAFGGLGIYKKAMLEGLSFHGLSPSGDAVCEWVGFNEQLCEKGYKLFINPQLVNGGFNEHSLPYKGILEQMRGARSV